jgi:hypothetical protein
MAVESCPQRRGGKDCSTDSRQVKRKNVRHVHDGGVPKVRSMVTALIKDRCGILHYVCLTGRRSIGACKRTHGQLEAGSEISCGDDHERLWFNPQQHGRKTLPRTRTRARARCTFLLCDGGTCERTGPLAPPRKRFSGLPRICPIRPQRLRLPQHRRQFRLQ